MDKKRKTIAPKSSSLAIKNIKLKSENKPNDSVQSSTLNLLAAMNQSSSLSKPRQISGNEAARDLKNSSSQQTRPKQNSTDQLFAGPRSLANLVSLSGGTITLSPSSDSKNRASNQYFKVNTPQTTKPSQNIDRNHINELSVNLNSDISVNTQSISGMNSRNHSQNIDFLSNYHQSKISQNKMVSGVSELLLKAYRAKPSCTNDIHQSQACTSHLNKNNPNIAHLGPSSTSKQELSVNDLVKLVSILNNPALTITPVSRNDSRVNDERTTSYSTGRCNSNQPKQQNRNGVECQMKSVCNKISGTPSNSKVNEHNHNSRNMQSAPRSVANLSKMLNERILLSEDTDFRKSTIHHSSMSSSLNFEESIPKKNVSVSSINTRQESNLFADPRSRNCSQLSTSVKNLIMQQPGFDSLPETQFLHHISQNTRDEWSHQSLSHHNRVSKFLDLDLGISEAKEKRCEVYISGRDILKERTKQPLETTAKRLFVRKEQDNNRNQENVPRSLNPIEIFKDVHGGSSIFISDRHQMIESMMPKKKECRKNVILEPDEIFLNRPKRVMSKIDSMVERKKLKRFHKISSRAKPKSESYEDQLRDSEDEWSEEEFEYSSVDVIKTHLPSEEKFVDERKRFFLSQVGLVSRKDKEQILIKKCEKKRRLYCPLVDANIDEKFADDIKRLVKTLIDNDGKKLRLTVDTRMKSHELPLVEGLDRSRNRTKLAYMARLGLDKQSKKGGLYNTQQETQLLNDYSISSIVKTYNRIVDKQLAKTDERNRSGSKPVRQNHLAPPNSVIDTSIPEIKDKKPKAVYRYSHNNTNDSLPNGMDSTQEISSQPITTCRAAVLMPTKCEFMESLGLVASENDFY